MQITDVRVRKVSKEGKMKAVVSITLDNEFVVHDILAAAAAAGPFGAEVVPVARQDYNKPLAVLAGLDDDPGTVLPFNGGPLGGRMVVLCGLEDQVDCLLPALRQAGIGRDCLKAVLTPHNRTWTAVKLYQELLREHQAMNGR